MLLDRLAVWWLKRRSLLYWHDLTPAGVVALHRRPWPRWVKLVLQGVLVAFVALGSLGYCYRYSLLGSAPGP